ncbi:DUF1295 domain-containing protein [Antrihabitans cavernicola]|uniref:DUF1295 domain-containing protein n=1 Tax=Antrihabitans cavernicola TaxID=2495913 RepID=A0A5A7S760_9NOCA|nr:DUF1295 domain-containing protein [Spelaeibacter cavernicola]KAA0021726.1 DUF1295 domain-containing protein [Spelaeibacter cavernicola]
MTGFDWGTFAAVSITSAVVLGILQIVTYAVGKRIGRFNVVDVIWGLGFVLVALVAAVLGGSVRSTLILVLVAVWGLRLSWHMVQKSKGKGEDPRYDELLGPDPSAALVLRKIFLTQGIAQWFVSLPLQVSAATHPTHGFPQLILLVGVLLALVGIAFETIGDRQLAAFKANPANKGKVMDVGLWAWTRHPNYFGDASVWWGLWLIAASAWPGILTVLSPVVMTYFLVFATGARLLEKSMSQRPGYPEYQKRTSYFLPRPPKK